jgi:ATP-binding cassette subfamily B protein RaxB
MGDIVSRFHSMRAIESLVANSAVETLVDGLMAVTTVIVMFAYSAQLAGIVLCAVALYATTRLLLFDALRTATSESLMLGAHADSVFMESIRAILPLKSYGREAVQEGVWQNRRAEAINAELRKSRLELIQQMANSTVFGMEAVTVLWIGALAILDSKLSVGMLVAFIAYKSHFTDRAAALIDRAVEFKLIGLHLDRLADIALADRDPCAECDVGSPRCFTGSIEVRNLRFRYAAGEPYVINGLNLKVEGGECVAITGSSGLGKTTLTKLMMGLLEPTSGQILVDGMDLQRGTLGDYRRQVAGVMQDDVLLSGTLADNISFFDPNQDQAWLETCAQLAAIHDDIMHMPMRYLTPVGDMGNTLSSGQRQRICLARALYARPRILFLDEATSHLDSFTEHRVHQAMADLKITRIIVAHRRETLAVANRVVQLQRRISANDTPQPSAAI